MMVTFWMKDGKAHGWWKRRENPPLWVSPSWIQLQMQLAGSSYESESESVKVKALKWVSPSFKYTLNCKYTYNHPPNTPSTILQIHKYTFKCTFNCRCTSNLFPRTKSSGRLFRFFSGKSAGVKLTEAHSCRRAHIVLAGITARIWVGLSNENVCNVGLG